MELKRAIEILERHNEWRRGGDTLKMAKPESLGIAIDTVVDHYKNQDKNV